MFPFLPLDGGWFMLRKKECKWAEGYFTVEASIIVPLAIFLISFIFYMTFFLYNRCAASQDAYILAFRGSVCSGYGKSYHVDRVCKKNPEEIRQLVIRQCGEQFGEKYMGIRTLIGTVNVDRKKVIVEVAGTMTTAFTEWLLPHKDWGFQVNGQAERICPTELIRKVRVLKRIKDKIDEKMIIE